MRVLVTGNNGYVGTVLTPTLLAAGYDVVGMDANFFIGCSIQDDVPNVPTLVKDVRDVCAADLRGFEAVIHLAALSNDPLGDYRPQLTASINHEAAVRLAQLAKQVGVGRLLFASSCSNYGAAGERWLAEDAPLHPVTPYAHSKTMAEREIAQLADGRFSPVFCRAATVYGYSPMLRFDLVINNLTAWAATTGRVHLKSDGAAWRPVIHVEDLAAAYLALLSAPRRVVHNQTFNVGSSQENYKVRELAELVRKVVPGSTIEMVGGAQSDLRSYRVDFDKIAREIPDFRPRWTAQKGIEQLARMLPRMQLSTEDFEGPKYRRIDHMKQLIAQGYLDENLRRAREG